MDSGRFILAVVLMIAVMVVTNLVFPSRPRTLTGAAADSARVDSIRRATQANAPAGTPAATTQPGTVQPLTPGVATPLSPTAAAPQDTVYVTANGRYRYGFSTRGGALVVAQILAHKSHAAGHTDQVVDLAAIGRPLISYKLALADQQIDLASLDFTPMPPQGFDVTADGAQQLRMIHRDSSGLEVQIDYNFSANTYLVDATVAVRNIGQRPAKLLIAMGPALAQTETDTVDDARHRAYVVNSTKDGLRDMTFIRFAKAGGEQIENGPLAWFALRNKYFVSAVLESETAKMPFGGVVARPIPARTGAELTATLLPGANNVFSFRTYVGPQEPKQLEQIGAGFKDVNPFGWRWARPMLRPIGHGLAALLYGMHDLLGVSFGWVLILFGVLIRVVLWPLNAKAMRSQMKNMEMQPRIKEIQTKYKADPARMQQEMLKLYKEEKFNPMGGCLPSLIPFPILITLYFVFANAIAFRGVEFMWLPDLSRPDPLYILPVLLGASMFVLQWFSLKGATGEQNQQMKIMMYTMPPFMTFIFLRFASGLNLYYTAMNLASIPQQMLIMRERERAKAARETSTRVGTVK